MKELPDESVTTRERHDVMKGLIGTRESLTPCVRPGAVDQCAGWRGLYSRASRGFLCLAPPSVEGVLSSDAGLAEDWSSLSSSTTSSSVSCNNVIFIMLM